MRFGEVEARAIALSPEGRARYDQAVAVADADAADADGAAAVWAKHFPSSETESVRQRAWCLHGERRHRPLPQRRPAPGSVEDLIREGWLRTKPVVYEDFLPRSAAGIFQSQPHQRRQQGRHGRWGGPRRRLAGRRPPTGP